MRVSVKYQLISNFKKGKRRFYSIGKLTSSHDTDYILYMKSFFVPHFFLDVINQSCFVTFISMRVRRLDFADPRIRRTCSTVTGDVLMLWAGHKIHNNKKLKLKNVN